MSYLMDAIKRLEKNNTDYLIEIHGALDLALSQRNWELVAFCLDNIEEYMNGAILGVKKLETK